jgi:hypothetical protein
VEPGALSRRRRRSTAGGGILPPAPGEILQEDGFSLELEDASGNLSLEF